MTHLKAVSLVFAAISAHSALAQELPLLPSTQLQILIESLPALPVPTPIQIPPPICQQTEWKSISEDGQTQEDCEYVPYTATITDLAGTSGKAIALALKKVGSTTSPYGQPALQHIAEKSAALAKQLEESPIANGFFHDGDGNIANPERLTVSAQIRAGFIPEADPATCKGNVIFLEGLADSMQNHLPLFKELSSANYRVIAFDYMGQGGSRSNGESANNLRIEDIPDLGEKIYKRYATNAACKKKILLGWSTGGLAAYYWAADRMTDASSITSQIQEAVKNLRDPNKNVPSFMLKPITSAMNWLAQEIETYLPNPAQTLSVLPKGPATSNLDIDAVVLMAPALAVRAIPGKTDFFNFTTVTAGIMTPNAEAQKAYVDPFVPEHVADVPNLAGNILVNSILSRAVYYYPIPVSFKGVNLTKYMGLRLRWAAWTVPDRIKGLILVASEKDKFTHSEALVDQFPRPSDPGMAPNFKWVSYQELGKPAIYPPAFHGLDNERPAIAGAVKSEILGFLNKL